LVQNLVLAAATAGLGSPPSVRPRVARQPKALKIPPSLSSFGGRVPSVVNPLRLILLPHPRKIVVNRNVVLRLGPTTNTKPHQSSLGLERSPSLSAYNTAKEVETGFTSFPSHFGKRNNFFVTLYIFPFFFASDD
jgi:hypothetical protein